MLTCGHIRPTEIPDHDVVGAVERAEVDVLDIVEVHRDVGDVAEEPHPPAVCRNIDVLGYVCAKKQHGIRTILAFDGIVAVTGVPLEDVVACTKQREIVAAVTVNEIVAISAEQDVVPWLPRMTSSPAPPSIVSLTSSSRQAWQR